MIQNLLHTLPHGISLVCRGVAGPAPDPAGSERPGRGTGLLNGLERWLPDLQVQRVPQASHWIVHEQPALVAGVMRSLLQPSGP